MDNQVNMPKRVLIIENIMKCATVLVCIVVCLVFFLQKRCLFSHLKLQELYVV